MCGIAGEISFAGKASTLYVEKMLEKLAPRGPDGDDDAVIEVVVVVDVGDGEGAGPGQRAPGFPLGDHGNEIGVEDSGDDHRGVAGVGEVEHHPGPQLAPSHRRRGRRVRSTDTQGFGGVGVHGRTGA